MLGLDLGGSTLNAVIYNSNKIAWKKQFILSNKSCNNIIDLIKSIIEKSKQNKIGIGIPGTLCENIIVKCPNFSQLNDLNLSKELNVDFIKLENDANCFALGEYNKYKQDLIGITIGTGIGGGIIINNKIYRGKGDAGEFGHITIYPNGVKCSCGNRGCLEEYISVKAFKRESKKIYGKQIDASKLFTLAKKGDYNAISIFKRAGKFLGIGIANIINVLNPSIISIGGGISGAWEFLIESAKYEMEKRIFISKPKIILGDKYSGALGAAMLWVEK